MKASISTAVFLLIAFTASAKSNHVNKPTEQNGNYLPTKISDLEAVLVVGPQSGDTVGPTLTIDHLAELFEANGIKVTKFYFSNAKWEDIKLAAKNASFFVYKGHGTHLAENGGYGGLCLTKMISEKTILAELKLKKNAMVIFESVCGGAGSSASDDDDIGIDEANKRVEDYSQPFFKLGASCYYANNISNGCYTFLEKFLAGKTVKECYEATTQYSTKVELTESYSFDKAKQLSIASTDWGGSVRTTITNGVKTVENLPGFKHYSIAYVANDNLNIKDLLQ